ncbi:MAG: class II fructose-bisphosphate aldolase family protein [Negativicutes bacterium]|nr:class II fructose-bisphosphate aldolase family protein [Negativicutes bacterium]
MITSGVKLLGYAQAKKYAIPAFNFHNLEVLQAIVETAEQEKSPVILQITPVYLKNIGAAAAAAMAKAAAMNADVPVVLHLDHGNDFDWAVWALSHGFNSVMIDGSRLPLEQNIAISRLVAQAAHAAGASAEAELGHIGGVEDSVDGGSGSVLADPEEAAKLARESNIDFLAPALGTAHGIYTKKPTIDFARLREIRSLTAVPLVLHGGSGIPEDMIREAIAGGISKINFGTELKNAWHQAVKDMVAQESEPWKIACEARKQVGRVVKDKILLCGSGTKA